MLEQPHDQGKLSAAPARVNAGAMQTAIRPGRALALAMATLVAAVGARADPPAPKRVAASIAYFGALQEAGAFSPDEMAQRKASGGLDADALAADEALNVWKTCVTEAIGRWGELHPGPGTLVDGAFGRCADAERAYRDALLHVTQDGRLVVDMQLARSMMRTLEEAWRPRLIAAALDQELALRHPNVPLAGE